MKIAIVNVSEAITPHGGVRIQGIMWHDCLTSAGHECELIDFWKENEWASYDVVIVLGYGGMLLTLSKGLRPVCKKLVLAPIIDPKWSTLVYKFFVKYWGCKKFTGLSSRFHDFYLASKYYDLFLTRSEYETMYVHKCLDVPTEKIKIVPLAVRTPILDTMPIKENFVFHVSRLKAVNKNVPRLIQAAIKYNFKLKLAGNLNGPQEKDWLDVQIKGHNNIEYLGELSEQNLLDWYTKAKVFALPSLQEGVGMVALEAAGRGDEIVLTNDGAPKEYYKGLAYLVNPKSVDSIGKACKEALKESNKQSKLLHFIKCEYSLNVCSEKLVNALKNAT